MSTLKYNFGVYSAIKNYCCERKNTKINRTINVFFFIRILGLRRVPLAVGRKVNLKQEVIPVASQALLNTFYKGLFVIGA